jgi:hypothetical protein
LLLAALVWLGLTGTTTVVLSRRAKLVKRFRPSPKLKQGYRSRSTSAKPARLGIG